MEGSEEAEADGCTTDRLRSEAEAEEYGGGRYGLVAAPNTSPTTRYASTFGGSILSSMTQTTPACSTLSGPPFRRDGQLLYAQREETSRERAHG